MDLKDFMKSTLLQIVEGTAEAQEELRGRSFNRASINPRPSGRGVVVTGPYGQLIERIEFDVAVTVAEGKEVKGGAAVLVASVIGLGTQAQRSSENTK